VEEGPAARACTREHAAWLPSCGAGVQHRGGIRRWQQSPGLRTLRFPLDTLFAVRGGVPWD
jgi:hypothetical protein